MTAYKTITADPPWKESGGGKIKRGADRHYPLMSLRDIDRTIRTCPKFLPADDAHLYLWVTNSFLPEGLELMRLLGFRYVTNTAWVKMKDWDFDGIPVDQEEEYTSFLEIATWSLQKGLGQYQRGAHELLLFGTRGKAMVPPPPDRLPSVVFAPRVQRSGKDKHSAKPEEFYKRIELVSPGPFLELFAREPRKNWEVWGNEV